MTSTTVAANTSGHREPMQPPKVFVFDVNETLSDLSSLGARFVEVGAPAPLSSVWFASVLRDGFALSVAGAQPSFGEVAREVARHLLSQTQLNRSLDEATDHVMQGLRELQVHPDVGPGILRLVEQDRRVVTLSNGPTSVAEALLSQAGLDQHFERLLSVEDAEAWKPDARAYAYAAEVCGVEPAEVMLVAVHPWDIDGAVRTGLQAAWVDRTNAHYPTVFEPPTCRVADLEGLAALWE